MRKVHLFGLALICLVSACGSDNTSQASSDANREIRGSTDTDMPNTDNAGEPNVVVDPAGDLGRVSWQVVNASELTTFMNEYTQYSYVPPTGPQPEGDGPKIKAGYPELFESKDALVSVAMSATTVFEAAPSEYGAVSTIAASSVIEGTAEAMPAFDMTLQQVASEVGLTLVEDDNGAVNQVVSISEVDKFYALETEANQKQQAATKPLPHFSDMPIRVQWTDFSTDAGFGAAQYIELHGSLMGALKEGDRLYILSHFSALHMISVGGLGQSPLPKFGSNGDMSQVLVDECMVRGGDYEAGQVGSLVNLTEIDLLTKSVVRNDCVTGEDYSSLLMLLP